MTIEALKRISLVGLARQKVEVLERLQSLGCLHLVALAPTPKEPETLPPEHAVDASKALRYLQEEPQKRRQVRADADFDMAETVRRVLANKDRLREMEDRRDALAQRVQDLTPWGDFQLPPGEALAGRKLWFYLIPRSKLKELAKLQMPWQVVHQDNLHAYVVVIHPQEPPGEALPVPRTHTGRLSLAAVRQQLEDTEAALEDIRAERQALTRWIYLMMSHFAQAEDQAALKHAGTQTLDAEDVFAVQGWMGVSKAGEVEALAREQGLALLIEDPAADDQPPTLLRNPESLGAAEGLVTFYQMPAYRSWDPSRALFFSFAIFFAMILSDAGYAGVLGLGLLAFWRKLGESVGGRRFRVLAATIATASLAWGVLVGSYFGVAPPPESLLGQLHLLDVQDFDSMMRLSIGIGVLHLVLANGVRAVGLWPRFSTLVPLGWILVAVGGYSGWLLSGSADPAGATVAFWVLGLGLVLVFFAGSERAFTGPGSILMRGVDGLLSLTQITKIFGDALSYLRLFALGLASASLALTFNDLAAQVAAQVEGLGLLLKILLLVIGHALNLLLGVVSGVVHGLRLNYIEFYNWALSGEGYPFRPFKKTEIRE